MPFLTVCYLCSTVILLIIICNNNKIVINRIVDFDDIYEEGYRYVVEVKAVKKHNGKPYEDEIYTYDYYLIRVLEKLKE